MLATQLLGTLLQGVRWGQGKIWDPDSLNPTLPLLGASFQAFDWAFPDTWSDIP